MGQQTEASKLIQSQSIEDASWSYIYFGYYQNGFCLPLTCCSLVCSLHLHDLMIQPLSQLNYETHT